MGSLVVVLRPKILPVTLEHVKIRRCSFAWHCWKAVLLFKWYLHKLRDYGLLDGSIPLSWTISSSAFPGPLVDSYIPSLGGLESQKSHTILHLLCKCGFVQTWCNSTCVYIRYNPIYGCLNRKSYDQPSHCRVSPKIFIGPELPTAWNSLTDPGNHCWCHPSWRWSHPSRRNGSDVFIWYMKH